MGLKTCKQWIILGIVLLGWSGAAHAQPVITVPQPVVQGLAPDIRIAGLRPNEQVKLYSLWMHTRWEQAAPGDWRPVPAPVVAWAELQADRRGRVDLARADVRRGTWRGRDPYGPFWSGRRPGSAAGAELPPLPASVRPETLREGEMRLLVVRGDTVIAQAPVRFGPAPNLRFAEVTQGQWHGVYAAPIGARRLPTIILLHGSEGGGRDEARAMAARYAANGFAALALNYFAWDMKNLPAIPNVHVNIPLERIAEARTWLEGQPEADVSRLGLYGH